MNFKLIDDINEEINTADILYENCSIITDNIELLAEEADKLIGKAIAALNAGKNPFETIPGSRELIAGLMLIAKESNRDALNINDKKFDLISQFVDEKDGVKKYVSKIGTLHGKSLLKNLDSHVSQSDMRKVLAKKLTKLQQSYSTVKHRASGITKQPHGVAKLA